MTLYVDHVTAEKAFFGAFGERKIMSHDAQLISSEDEVLDFIKRKISGASAVRVIYTSGDALAVFTHGTI